jgi:hypothetical protein
MATKLTRLTHKIATQLRLVTELYHLQFSRQAASPETFRYTLIWNLDMGLKNVKSLSLTKYYTVNTYYGSEGIAPRILKLGTRCR